MKMEVVLQVIHIQIMEKLLSMAQKISTMKYVTHQKFMMN